MRLPLAISLLFAMLLTISACGGSARPKPFILPEDWAAKSTEERLTHVFKETGQCTTPSPTGPATTTVTLIEVLPDQLKLGKTYEVFEEGSETHKFHTQQELVLPLDKINLQGVTAKPGTSGEGTPSRPPEVEIHLTVDKDSLLKWTGKDLITGEPKDSSPMVAITLAFRTDNACDEAAKAILELARKAQGVPEPAPQPQ